MVLEIGYSGLYGNVLSSDNCRAGWQELRSFLSNAIS